MPSSGILRLVDRVIIDVSEETSASIIIIIIHHINNLVFLRSVHRLLLTASVVPSSLTPITLMMEALSSSETLVLTRATRRNIPEDGILHNHSRENLKSYIALTAWAL
jgi:hypothetical protein